MFGTDYGHAEVMSVFGEDPRTYSVRTKEFVGDDEGNVKALVTVDVEISKDGVVDVPGSEREWPTNLVVLSMGFVSPEKDISSQLGLNLDQRSNIHAEYGDYRTNVEGVFAAGDCRRGQSLVVWPSTKDAVLLIKQTHIYAHCPGRSKRRNCSEVLRMF